MGKLPGRNPHKILDLVSYRFLWVITASSLFFVSGTINSSIEMKNSESGRDNSEISTVNPMSSVPRPESRVVSQNMKEPLLRDSTMVGEIEPLKERKFQVFKLPEEDPDDPLPDNMIVTSRFTLMTFIPKAMFEQFRRMANIYFLVLGIIAFVAEQTNYYATSVEASGLLLPMLLVVMISMIKDGYEDYKRHSSDAIIAAKEARQVTSDGNVVSIQWKDLRVGSVILLLCDDEVPADVAVLSCGGVQGPSSYVETAAIDGETNLKLRLPVLDEEAVKQVYPKQDKKEVVGCEIIDKYDLTIEPPNSSIGHFSGSIMNKRSSKATMRAMDEKNLILRGSIMKATEWTIGVVVYTGKDSKLALNSKTPPSKLSSIDRIVNKTLLIAIMSMILVCLISMVFQVIWNAVNDDATYLCLERNDLNTDTITSACTSSAPNEFLSIFTFATLYNNFVCISMYVSLEMVYLVQAWLMFHDLNMYDEKNDTPCVVHNSSLCADIGQIEYVLSDKTGTLTKNNMCLKRCSIQGVVYGAPIQFPGAKKAAVEEVYSELEALPNLNPANGGNEIQSDFIRTLTICNTVMLMPDAVTGSVNVDNAESLLACLQAESPDEVALVEFAAIKCDMILTRREGIHIGIKCKGENECNESYKLLAVNQFESDRKRMSLLVSDPDNSDCSILFCKGADSSMLPLCKKNEYTEVLQDNVDTFARTGLRTLVMAKRKLNKQETDDWMKTYNSASNSISNRSKALAKCAASIERDMELLGAVGIEDELQDNVADSINIVREAGINTWMITGDKPETAMAIGHLSGLLKDEHSIERVVGLTGRALKERIHELNTFITQLSVPHLRRTGEFAEQEGTSTCGKCCSTCGMIINNIMLLMGLSQDYQADDEYRSSDKEKVLNSTSKLALVVDGISLEGIWAKPKLQAAFTNAARQIPTVIASRVSPLQKATLVRMVKTGEGNPVTLAIGDGANDVGMIHEARVGVGISGKEGKHASNAADFAISEFQHIVPLLLQHGRFNYVRCSKLVLYSFFKNLVLVSVLFYYAFYNGISGTIFVDSLVLAGFNFYLGLPIIVIGAFDWDITREQALKYPRLAYNQGRQREELNMYTFGRCCLLSFVEGFILFAISIRFIAGNQDANGNAQGTGEEPKDFYDLDGVGLNTSDGKAGGIYAEGFLLYSIVVIAMTYKVALMGTFNWLVAATIVISMIGYYIFVFSYNFVVTIDWYGVVSMAMSTPNYWIACFVAPIFMALLDVIFEGFLTIMYPTSRDKLHSLAAEEEERNDPDAPSIAGINRANTSATDFSKTNSISGVDTFPRMNTTDFSPLTADKGGGKDDTPQGTFNI